MSEQTTGDEYYKLRLTNALKKKLNKFTSQIIFVMNLVPKIIIKLRLNDSIQVVVVQSPKVSAKNAR